MQCWCFLPQMELLYFPNFFLSHSEQYRWWVHLSGRLFTVLVFFGGGRLHLWSVVLPRLCPGIKLCTRLASCCLGPHCAAWRSENSGSCRGYRSDTQSQGCKKIQNHYIIHVWPLTSAAGECDPAAVCGAFPVPAECLAGVCDRPLRGSSGRCRIRQCFLLHQQGGGAYIGHVVSF